MNNTYGQVESRRIDIASDTALSLDVSAGDVIRCIRGQVWLTQENDSRDYCLVAGVSFCADRSGRAVLSAIDDDALVLVEPNTPATAGRRVRGTVRIDSVEAIVRRARHAQAEWVAAFIASAIDWLRARAGMTPRTRPES